MARFLIRSLISTLITMLLVSAGLFALIEIGSGDITVKILGIFSTPEQRESFRSQLGLSAPPVTRYLEWLAGSDWRAERKVGLPLVRLENPSNGEKEWWAQQDDRLVRWKMSETGLEVLVRQHDGSSKAEPETREWQPGDNGDSYFWGVDTKNNAVKWVHGATQEVWVVTKGGLRKQSGGALEYIPLKKGLVRGDPGMSLQYNRPVAGILGPRILNTTILAAVAFFVVVPIALFLGVIAGVNEGKAVDRVISIGGLGATATPEFVTGIFLIMILGLWLQVVPAVSFFVSDDAIFKDPSLLVLPVLTLTLIELGYVARMTRASMVEVMRSAYIRTAFVKGMPYWRVVFSHALRNALIVPITVIMLHVNWLIGGVVVVEVIFGYPGLGKFIFDAAIFGDFHSVMAAAMVTVTIAIATRLSGDLAYTLLNPRIRYA